MKLIWVVAFALITIVQTSVSADQYKVIEPASKKELAPIVQRIKKQFEVDKDEFHEYRHLENLNGYYIDVNNDGKKEYVFEDYQGSGNYLCLYAFCVDEKEIRLLDDLETDFSHEFYNVITKKNELFVSAQNKIYICVSNDSFGYNRSVYLYEKNATKAICDPFWINKQRALFNELYKNQNYEDAVSLLRNFESEFRHSIDPQTDLWLRNDLALAMIKNKMPYTSLSLLASIKGDTAFAHATQALKKAIQTNEILCKEAIKEERKQGTKGDYDYRWLLEYKAAVSSNAHRWDKRVGELFAAVVPDISSYHYNEELESIANGYLRAYIERHFDGPLDGVTVLSDRYITFSGFYPHCATNKGFMWCDCQKQVSAVAIGGELNKYSKESHPLCIFSRSLLIEEFPKEFFDSLKDWVKGYEIDTRNVIICDRSVRVSWHKL